MKNTFAVTMTLLLALTLGGSYLGYRLATTPHEAAAEAGASEPAAPAEAAASEGEAATSEATTEATSAPSGEAAAATQTAQGDATKGAELYASATCVACHGAQGQGGVGLPLNKPDGPMSWTDAQFATAIREGKTPTRELAATMPRQAQLTDAQLTDLHAFIKTFK